MTVSTYTVNVEADNADDALDIAKRRAKDDGFTVRTVKRVRRSQLPNARAWVVELAVAR